MYGGSFCQGGTKIRSSNHPAFSAAPPLARVAHGTMRKLHAALTAINVKGKSPLQVKVSGGPAIRNKKISTRNSMTKCQQL
jgi:hypothetical protein